MKLNSTHLHKNTPACLETRTQASFDCKSGGNMQDRDGTFAQSTNSLTQLSFLHGSQMLSIRGGFN